MLPPLLCPAALLLEPPLPRPRQLPGAKTPAGEQGAFSGCGAWPSHCSGFSCYGAWAPGPPGFSGGRAWAQWLNLLGVTSQGHIGQSPEHPECLTRRSEAVAPLHISGEGSCIMCLYESVQGDLACRKVNLTKWQMASALIERSLLKSISFSSQLLHLKGVTLHETHSLFIPFFKASNFVDFFQHLSMFIPQTR